MLINSPNNNDAKISPNMEENDNTNTDLIIPNLFILLEKSIMMYQNQQHQVQQSEEVVLY
jgi:hypothetical protein